LVSKCRNRRPFSIDPVSGLLSWCNPQFNGDYNIVIRIKEWRNDSDGAYFLVGYVERDTQISISGCTGIHETQESENSISLFPNPVNENFTVTFNQNTSALFNFELIDITGRKLKILSENEPVSKQKNVLLKLENIQPGIYFLKITNDQGTRIIKKIIKQ
jgi:hypothetical protein